MVTIRLMIKALESKVGDIMEVMITIMVIMMMMKMVMT